MIRVGLEALRGQILHINRTLSLVLIIKPSFPCDCRSRRWCWPSVTTWGLTATPASEEPTSATRCRSCRLKPPTSWWEPQDVSSTCWVAKTSVSRLEGAWSLGFQGGRLGAGLFCCMMMKPMRVNWLCPSLVWRCSGRRFAGWSYLHTGDPETWSHSWSWIQQR